MLTIKYGKANLNLYCGVKQTAMSCLNGTRIGIALRAARYPRFEQRIGDGEDNRTDEEAYDAESDESADHPGEDQQKRQVSALSYQERTNDVIHSACDK